MSRVVLSSGWRRTMVTLAVAVGAIGVLMTTAASSLPAQPAPTAILDGLRADGRRPIDFHAAVFPDSVYVGEQVTYQVAVLLSEQARSRLRRNPEFLPPELRGLLAYELGTPRRAAPRSYGGATFEAHVFQRALFAVKPGLITVPAPQLSYSLPQSPSFFSKEESYVVRAESALVVVRPLPEADRPAEFTGAVGVLRATARLDATSARVGDPLVLTLRVEGTGNVKLLPRLPLELSWATVVPGSERVQLDSAGPLVRGAKEFDFLLTPSQPGPAVLPSLRYSYFDPYRGVYAWAETLPTDVTVAPGSLATPGDGEEGALLPLRPWRQREQTPPALWPVAWRVGGGVVWVLAPLPALIMLWQRRRRRAAPAADPRTGANVMLHDPQHDAGPAGAARRVRRTLLEQLAVRLELPVADLVARRDLEQGLRRRGVTRATTQDVLTMLDALAVRGFGAPVHDGADHDQPRLQMQATALLERVDTEAVARGRTRRWARRGPSIGSTTLGVCLLIGALESAGWPAATAQAQAPSPVPVLVQDARTAARGGRTANVAELVREGTAAYERRRFQRAADLLGEAATRRPHDADVLVNWGSAAWAAADTVSAVIAWHRAARLEPLAADVQARLLMLPAGARGVLADVPMVPVAPLAVGGTVLWLLGWILLARHWRRRAPDATEHGTLGRALGAVMLCGALAAGGAAWWGVGALDGRALAVVRRPETLRVSPSLSANTLGGLGTGDVVRLEAVQEGWARIAHVDERRGWMPASRLAPLVAPSSAR